MGYHGLQHMGYNTSVTTGAQGYSESVPRKRKKSHRSMYFATVRVSQELLMLHYIFKMYSLCYHSNFTYLNDIFIYNLKIIVMIRYGYDNYDPDVCDWSLVICDCSCRICGCSWAICDCLWGIL